MNVRVALLVVCAAAVSARHFVDESRYLVQPFNPSPDVVESRQNTEITLERRNIDNRNEANLNQQGPTVKLLNRYKQEANKQNAERVHKSHESRKEISENIDNNNTIGNVQGEYQLRDNENVDSYSFTTEYLSDNTNVYMNTKPEATKQSNNRENANLKKDNLPKKKNSTEIPNITQYYRLGDAHVNMVTPKMNNHTDTSRNNPAQANVELNNLYLSNNSNQNTLTPNRGVLFVNNNTKQTDNVKRIKRPKTNESRRNLVKNIRRNDTRVVISERNDTMIMPTDEDDSEDEIGWVWGTESSENELTTEKDDLGNRAAFSGNGCPTEKVKVKGLCVDKQ